MDLHAWIIQQVDTVERSTLAKVEHQRVVFAPHDGGPALTGTVTGATQASEGLQLEVAQYSVEPVDGAHADMRAITAVLRRCEADRRILARHRLDPAATSSSTFETACEGCRNDWVWDDPEPHVDNLNDCPELLDLAHAHGITDEILAGLDQPQAPKPPPRSERRLGFGNILATPPITTADIPAVLRGTRWKP